MDELDIRIKYLSNLKSEGESGMVAEMITYDSVESQEELLRYFNHSLQYRQFDKSWFETTFRMIPKDGNLNEIPNWRPIVILPIFYNLFI